MTLQLLWLCFAMCIITVLSEVQKDQPVVRVNKCCEPYELYIGKYCTHINKTNETLWHPFFTTEHGSTNIQVDYVLVTGLPDCGSMQPWAILHYTNSLDVLRLLPNGVLRHYAYHSLPGEDESAEIETLIEKDVIYHDYEPGKYCLEKKVDSDGVSEYAIVCAPKQSNIWSDTEFLMRNIVSPITHGIAIISLLIVAIVYFIMPTLRDLVGNIVTTICMCLIVNQTSDMIRLLTVFSNHISLIITETICCISLLGGFFWLNSLGYYIWKTFKSRNVYLRITDGKKYCYYSFYAWSSTLGMGIFAVTAHFMMDYPHITRMNTEHEQEAIGSLGMIIFFVPVAFIVLVNIFFFVTTLKIINRMPTYGRIHHKLKHSFRMFLLLSLVMTITWLFFLLSFSKLEGLTYCYIVLNSFQAPIILYICIFNQRHVSYLLRKMCCYKNCICDCCKPEPECEWGDEMTAMNTGMY